MHNAPSVSYPVGRCNFPHRLFTVLAAIAGLVAGAWWIYSPSLWLGFAALCWGLACALAWRSFQQQTGQLIWDGQHWHWQVQEPCEDTDALQCVGAVSVQLDLQHLLLLSWQPLSATHRFQQVNLWLAAEAAPEFWQDLRRAVYAHDRHP